MMIQPAVSRAKRGLRKASTYSIPAPVGGWNVRDPLAAMGEKDAIVLENFFPGAGGVDLRPGSADWSTGYAAPVRHLMAWNGLGSQKMFAATDTGIFDATTQGAVGAAAIAVTNGYMSSVSFNVLGGAFLIAVNGVDKLKLYNGTAWADIDAVSVPISITGLATTSLTNVAVLKRRLWFVQKDSMSAWYLPVAQVGGVLTEFPLGQVFTKGGHLVAIGNWTIDGGNGSDDYGVFISSEGEVAVYRGTDPASATDWNLIGVYYVGEPIGKNCFCKFGGDVLILCRNGLYPLSEATLSATVSRAQSLTNKIDTAFINAAKLYGDNRGWDVVVYPQGSFVLVNVPITTSYTEQYVMNTTTKAWCKFLGMPAASWLVFDAELYFASGNGVSKAWTGKSDKGAAIVGRAQQAYNDFRRPAQQKLIKLLRPILTTDGNVGVGLSLDTDYSINDFTSITTPASSPGAIWDTALWDGANWAGSSETRRGWASVAAREGYTAALRLQVTTNSVTLGWSATDFVYELGGVL